MRRPGGVSWTCGEIGEDGDPLHRCTLAHYLADTQDDPADELAWDLRALSAAEELTDGDAAERHRSLAARAFYPSLHLNLAADYVKLGRSEAARSHLRRARGAAGVLGNDRYGDGVRAAIGRLELRLDGTGPSHGGPGRIPAPSRGPAPSSGPVPSAGPEGDPRAAETAPLDPADTGRGQCPYERLQMTASGLSAFQPPYFRPRAHTSVLFGSSGAAGGTSVRGAGRWG